MAVWVVGLLLLGWLIDVFVFFTVALLKGEMIKMELIGIVCVFCVR